VRTVGIDVSSQPRGTASCSIEWTGSGARIESVETSIGDARLESLLRERADKVGIDVPLGWPRPFVVAVESHADGRPFGEEKIERLARRQTDLWVWKSTGQLPLSVTTDRIAYPAMRVARILGRLPDLGSDRSGAGKLVEVYPAAALRVWRLQYRQYKGAAGRAVLAGILGELKSRCPWLSASDSLWTALSDDHCFDALVAALIARAVAAGRCHPIPLESVTIARSEGWIAVPMTGSLEGLESRE
jgi:hypothetical protein